jgi:hypothetical protein
MTDADVAFVRQDEQTERDAPPMQRDKDQALRRRARKPIAPSPANISA